MRISDWSSDVCSSDLARCRYPATRSAQLQQPDRQRGGALLNRTKDQAAAVLPTLLKALRLPSINRNWKRLTDTAERDGWPHDNLVASLLAIEMADSRSEERRVGKECVSTCRSRGLPYHNKQKQSKQ